MAEPLQHSHVTEIILAGFYEVFNVLGSGFVEAVYIAALVIVLRRRGLQVEEKPSLPVYFHDRILGRFTPDFLSTAWSSSRRKRFARSRALTKRR